MSKVTVTFNKIIQVKESAHRYDIPRIINGPADAAEAINGILHLQDEAQEVLAILLLDTKNQVNGCHEISRGSLSASIVHPREVFKPAILCNAASIIMFHNHPSGNTEPSREDVAVTTRIVKAGKIIDIPCLDHIIIGHHSYLSMKEKGLAVY